MPKIKIERFLLIIFISIFCLTLLPSLVKRLLPAPKVIKTIPALSATNVPIETQQIQFVFNQPMTEEKNVQHRGMRIKGQPKWGQRGANNFSHNIGRTAETRSIL